MHAEEHGLELGVDATGRRRDLAHGPHIVLFDLDVVGEQLLEQSPDVAERLDGLVHARVEGRELSEQLFVDALVQLAVVVQVLEKDVMRHIFFRVVVIGRGDGHRAFGDLGLPRVALLTVGRQLRELLLHVFYPRVRELLLAPLVEFIGVGTAQEKQEKLALAQLLVLDNIVHELFNLGDRLAVKFLDLGQTFLLFLEETRVPGAQTAI